MNFFSSFFLKYIFHFYHWYKIDFNFENFNWIWILIVCMRYFMLFRLLIISVACFDQLTYVNICMNQVPNYYEMKIWKNERKTFFKLALSILLFSCLFPSYKINIILYWLLILTNIEIWIFWHYCISIGN